MSVVEIVTQINVVEVSIDQSSIDILESPSVVEINDNVGIQGIQGVGVPTGGTTGQVLSKINSTDYNTEWVTPSAGGGVGVNTYIQSTAPTVGAGIPYLWIDTTGGNLQFKIEDGA